MKTWWLFHFFALQIVTGFREINWQLYIYIHIYSCLELQPNDCFSMLISNRHCKESATLDLDSTGCRRCNWQRLFFSSIWFKSKHVDTRITTCSLSTLLYLIRFLANWLLTVNKLEGLLFSKQLESHLSSVASLSKSLRKLMFEITIRRSKKQLVSNQSSARIIPHFDLTQLRSLWA